MTAPPSGGIEASAGIGRNGPGNCEEAIDREIKNLLAQESGGLIFHAHGLDDEGWGPIRADSLDRLLQRLLAVETLEILPAGRVLAKYAS